MKKFACYWCTPEYTPAHEVRGLDDFTEDMGYTSREIKRINELELYESWEQMDHTVVRIA